MAPRVLGRRGHPARRGDGHDPVPGPALQEAASQAEGRAARARSRRRGGPRAGREGVFAVGRARRGGGHEGQVRALRRAPVRVGRSAARRLRDGRGGGEREGEGERGGGAAGARGGRAREARAGEGGARGDPGRSFAKDARGDGGEKGAASTERGRRASEEGGGRVGVRGRSRATARVVPDENPLGVPTGKCRTVDAGGGAIASCSCATKRPCEQGDSSFASFDEKAILFAHMEKVRALGSAKGPFGIWVSKTSSDPSEMQTSCRRNSFASRARASVGGAGEPEGTGMASLSRRHPRRVLRARACFFRGIARESTGASSRGCPRSDLHSSPSMRGWTTSRPRGTPRAAFASDLRRRRRCDAEELPVTSR